MDKQMNDRVIFLAKKKAKSVRQFAIQIGVDDSLMSLIKNHKHDVTEQTIGLILKRYSDVNEKWIKTGEGEMLKPPQVSEPAIEYFNSCDELYNYHKLVEKVKELDKTVQEIKKIIDLKDDN